MGINKAKGVTLVELAIVIVIIGLMTGGVMAGSALVNESKKNKLISQLRSLSLASATFQAKYNCRPGDCAKASTFVNSSLINGNGDGRILNNGPYDTGVINTATDTESFNAFSHLFYAGLIETLPSSDSRCRDIGDAMLWDDPDNPTTDNLYSYCNYPTSPFNVGYFLMSPDARNTYFSKDSFCINANAFCQYRIGNNIDVATVKEIDLKIDDGMPWKGRMLSANCSNAPDFDYFFDENSTYHLTYGSYTYDTTKSSCISMISL